MKDCESTLCITGYGGYIGRHLVKYLIDKGQTPFLIGRQDMHLPELPGALMARYWSTPTDLANQLSALDSPVIINLAGHFVKNHSPADMPAIIAGNLTYPAMIFEAMVLGGVMRMVNVGTSWEYTDTGIPEPLNMYAAVKKSNTVLLNWYLKNYPVRGFNLKLNDTYGGEDRRAKLMPMLKQHALTGKPVRLGYMSQQLNLTYISDVIQALLRAGQITEDQQPGTVDEAFVLGGETTNLGEIVALIQQITDNALDVNFSGVAPTDEALRDVWDGAPRLSGWSPAVDLRTGLTKYFQTEEREEWK